MHTLVSQSQVNAVAVVGRFPDDEEGTEDYRQGKVIPSFSGHFDGDDPSHISTDMVPSDNSNNRMIVISWLDFLAMLIGDIISYSFHHWNCMSRCEC